MERETLLNEHYVESESYVTRLGIWNPACHPRAFEVLIAYVKVQSDFAKTFDVEIN